MTVRTNKKLEAACAALRDGRATFQQFYAATLESWRSLARYILRRWRTPAACSEEDVIQELLLGAWRAVPKYEEGRGPTLAAFTVYAAVGDAKRWVHHQRGVSLHGNPDRGVATFDVLCYDPVQDDATATRVAAQHHPSPETTTIARDQACRVVAKVAEDRDQYALAAVIVAAGDRAEAARLVWADPTVRRRCRLSSERAAVRFVSRGMVLARHKVVREAQAAYV